MPVTLTDDQAAHLRQQLEIAERNRQVAELVNGIYSDPALGHEARALIKKKYPDLPIPDHDLRHEFNSRLDREKAEREEAERKAREKEEDERIAADRAATQKKYGFTDDGMQKVEKFMADNHVANYEVAAHYVAATEPKPSDETADYDRHYWNHGRSEEFKQIAQDPEGWARTEILRAVRAEAQPRG